MYMRTNRGAESESKSESPGVVATSQESESESESIKLPRLRLRIFYYNLARLGLAKNIFFGEIFGNITVLSFSEPTWRSYER